MLFKIGEIIEMQKIKILLYAINIILLVALSGLHLFAQPFPKPACPPSPVIQDIQFDFSTLKKYACGSDIWAITWAGDNNQYTTWGDGGGFGGTNNDGRVSFGFARIEGEKDNYKGINVWGGKGAENPVQSAFATGKSHGLISIEGILYMWRSNVQDQNYMYNSYHELYKSSNYAASWELTSVVFDFKDRQFFVPTFLQFGKDYKDARDDFVYIYAPEAHNDVWDVQFPGEIALMRVPISDITNLKVYEYFAGLDVNDNPTWTKNIQKRRAVFSDSLNGVMRTSVSYNKGLNRYLLITQHRSRYKGNDGYIGIYDAPTPWGPWTMVLFDNPWRIGLQNNKDPFCKSPDIKTVYWNFSNKWLSDDGKQFVLVYTGPSPDNWGTIEGEFIITESIDE